LSPVVLGHPVQKNLGRDQRNDVRRRVVAFNERHEGRYRRILETLLDEQRRVFSLRQATKLAAAVDVDGLLRMLRFDDFAEAARPQVTRLDVQSMEFGGDIAAESLTRQGLRVAKSIGSGLTLWVPLSHAAPGLGISFDVSNPAAQAWVKAHSALLIKEFGNANRDVIREILTNGFKNGTTPVKMARQIRDSGIGMTGRDAQALSNFFDREVAKLGGLAGTKRATALSKIATRRDRLAAKKIRQRSHRIARTESMRALNQGQLETVNQAKALGFTDKQILLEWMAVIDERTDDDCMVLDGVRIPKGELFQSQVEAPPLHVQCRCTISVILSTKKTPPGPSGPRLGPITPPQFRPQSRRADRRAGR